MRIGISMFPTDTSAAPGEVAAAVESFGFDSFWVSEHSHMPVNTQFPLADKVPREYSSMWDPFIALAAAASATQRIGLGTGICIITQRDPINTAKTVSSLDLLSNGRISLGVGAGWNEPEMQNHGTAPGGRFKLMRERVEAMRQLWTQEVAEYHGDLVDFDPVWQWPKPVQQPCPPVLIAGANPNVIKRVARYGDGWLPVVVPEATAATAGRVTTMADLMQQVPQMRALANAAGRAPPSVVVSGAALDPAVVDAMLSIAVDELVFRVPSADMDSVLAELEQLAAGVAGVASLAGR